MNKYRELLKKYMKYIGEIEGVYFIPETYNKNASHFYDIKDWIELTNLMDEINNETTKSL